MSLATRLSRELLLYRKNVVKKLLDLCLPDEQAFFEKLYGPVDKMNPDKISTAIGQCVTSIVKKGVYTEKDLGKILNDVHLDMATIPMAKSK